MNTINPSQLPQVRWQNQSVITTELLSRCYEAEEHQIRQNYANNKDRFIEGKHFFKLEGEALKTFKKSSNDQQQVNPLEDLLDPFGGVFHRVDDIYSVKIANNVNSLMLWTDKGAARHSKILDTDKAWEMFDQLEEAYFHPERWPPLTSPHDYETLQKKYIALLEQDNARMRATATPYSPEYSPAVSGGHRPWTPAQDQELLALKAEGYGWTAIGVKVGRSRENCRYRYNKLMGPQGGTQ